MAFEFQCQRWKDVSLLYSHFEVNEEVQVLRTSLVLRNLIIYNLTNLIQKKCERQSPLKILRLRRLSGKFIVLNIMRPLSSVPWLTNLAMMRAWLAEIICYPETNIMNAITVFQAALTHLDFSHSTFHVNLVFFSFNRKGVI